MKQAPSLVAAAALLLAAIPTGAHASAKSAPRMPVRIHATIEKLERNLMIVKTDKGGELTLELTSRTSISGVDRRSLTDLRPMSFIGVTAAKAADGALHATEIQVYPDAMRGVGEGHYGGGERTITNATVAALANSADGKMVTLSYQDKSTGKMQSIAIDAGRSVPVLAYVPADRKLLKPGADTMMLVAKEEDGDLIALAVVAEKDGVKPAP